VSYRWALAGIIETPYRITEAQFMGTISRTTNIPTAVRRGKYQVLRRAPFREEFELVFCMQGRRTEITFLLHRGRTVAHATNYSFFLDPAYRGQGLMSELVAESHLVTGARLLERVKKLHEQHYTHQAEAVARKAYHLMVERGAIVPG
jgi:GNAT superfamily N-acetyltransferase